MAGSVSISFPLFPAESLETIVFAAKRMHWLTARNRYGEDKELTEDYQKDIWEFGY